MHEVLEVGDLSSLPLESDIFELIDSETADWYSFGQYAIDLVPDTLIFKGEVVRSLLRVDLQSDFPQLVPFLEELLDFVDFYFFDGDACQVVEGFEVHFFISDEYVAVDGVEGQNLPGEDVVLFGQWFFGDAVDLAHVEGLLVELVDDHTVDALLQQVVVLLLAALVQKGHPLLQVLHVLVRGVNHCLQIHLLICSEMSSYTLKG